jgi:hypothetical protein
MDSQSPTKTDSGTDADPPDLTIDSNSTSISYELNIRISETFTDYQIETKIIDIPLSFSHEDSSGDDLSDFVLGLDLSSPKRLEFRLGESETKESTIPESKAYSSNDYTDSRETEINSRALVY